MANGKRDYLAVYDYGMGGAWVIIRARAKEEIMQKFPELIAYETRPKWMTEEVYNEYYRDIMKQGQGTGFMDIDDQPTGWFAELIKNRKQA